MSYETILNNTDQKSLLNQLDSSSSYVEYILILHRLSQLQDEYKVDGILNSQQYTKALKEYKAGKNKLAKLKASYESFDSQNIAKVNENILYKQAELNILGKTWKLNVAKQLFNQSPEFVELKERTKTELVALEAQVKPAPKKTKNHELEDIKKQLKIAILTKGAASKEVKELKKRKDSLEIIKDESLDNSKERVKLEKTKLLKEFESSKESLERILLGEIKTNTQFPYYIGGTIKLAPYYKMAKDEKEQEINIAYQELVDSASVANKKTNPYEAELDKFKSEFKKAIFKFQAHHTALLKAKLKAEIAKSKQPIFKDYTIDNKLAEMLKEYPYQLKAIFLKDSVFIDNVIYIYWDKKNKVYCTQGEVNKSKDSIATKAIKQKLTGEFSGFSSAKIEKNPISLPKYSSWATLEKGQALTRKDGKTVFRYIGHNLAKQDAPRSELGILKLSGLTPDKAVNLILELGLAKSVETKVPTNLIYRGNNTWGRVMPFYEPFSSGREILKVPDNHMILHGLTGVNSKEDALARLETIIETGGLKSISERRRMQLNFMTMSPLGDIASGIDMGVPCKIADKPTYGSHIFFALKPESLYRRDLWFSDRDFGGGHNRYPQYLKYANSLGQKSLDEPCPVKGRQKHLDNGLGNTNEVYFRYEINWNDVDTIFMEPSYAKAIKSKFEQWKKTGLIPKHIRLAEFNNQPFTSSTASSGDNIATTSWVIKEGKVIFKGLVLPSEQLTKTTKNKTSLSSKIQDRANELKAEFSELDSIPKDKLEAIKKEIKQEVDLDEVLESLK